ncbi:MAG: SPOR domain-containing protein, partial [Flavobacterium macrobrachii]
KKTLISFKKENKNMDGTIVFSTPMYKVWVGNFKTRIEAEKNLQTLKKKYPNAFLIKPNK